MHTMFFGFKRVHWLTVGFTRAFLLDGERDPERMKKRLTPARFDMMRIIDLHKNGAPQSKIQYLLGVSAATVSRMLTSLEDLGYVRREIMPRDARRVIVHITPSGVEELTRARRILLESGVADRSSLLAFHYERGLAKRARVIFLRYLKTIRRRFLDPAPHDHPWWAGDIVPLVFQTLVNGRVALAEPIPVLTDTD